MDSLVYMLIPKLWSKIGVIPTGCAGGMCLLMEDKGWESCHVGFSLPGIPHDGYFPSTGILFQENRGKHTVWYNHSRYSDDKIYSPSWIRNDYSRTTGMK